MSDGLLYFPNSSFPSLRHVGVKHALFQVFPVFGDATIKVAFHHQAGDGRGDGTTVATVFDVNKNGNFRIVLGRKSGEN